MSTHISLWQSVILGVIEGLTEFLPVSSTGHLTIAEDLMGLKTTNDAVTGYTAVIQDGAILAVIAYFWRDIVRVITGWARGLVDTRARRRYEYRFGWYIIWATVPIGIFGVVGKGVIEGPLRSLWFVAAALVVWSAVMLYAERTARRTRGEGELTLRDALVIGLFQCAALIPGVSRSGATLSAGLLRGIDRISATRFSFLLGIPALLAAGIFVLPQALRTNVGGGPVLVGTAVSFVVAYAAVAWFLRFVGRHSIGAFVPYRVALGLAVVGMLVAGVVQPT